MLLANKLLEKLCGPCNPKEHCQSFRRKKNTKSLTQSKIITYQPKTFENPNTVYIKSIITEHPKTSLKLSKSVSFLYLDNNCSISFFISFSTKD